MSWVLFALLSIALFGVILGILFVWQGDERESFCGILACLACYLPVLGPGLWLESLWQSRGMETVEIGKFGISVRHDIGRFGLTRKYPLAKIRSLFTAQSRDRFPFPFGRWFQGFFTYNYRWGAIAFGLQVLFGVREVMFGTSLTENEAQTAVALIHVRFPQYR
jgi:hypothetical protein